MPRVKCEFCGAFIDDTEEKCPNCGAVNAYYKRVVSDTPQTIEELKSWYMARKLPPESVTRFFIGKDIKEAKAFGIYQDGNNFVVYKNKADGSRAVRYRGTDEAYAVNEIYLKLKSEILNQKSRNLSRHSGNTGRSSSGNTGALTVAGVIAAATAFLAFIMPSWAFGLFAVVTLFTVGPVLLLLVLHHFFFRGKPILFALVSIAIILTLVGSFFLFAFRSGHRHDGYYTYNDTYYYCQGSDVYYYTDDDWYYYDSYDDFVEYYPDSTYLSDSYEGDEFYSDFRDSYYYEDWSSGSSSSSSDWSSDSDYDWDSGSDWDSGGSDWDSGDTDWDSDW